MDWLKNELPSPIKESFIKNPKKILPKARQTSGKDIAKEDSWMFSKRFLKPLAGDKNVK